MLSILGFYNYNPGVFDKLFIPDGLDFQLVVDNILMECAELEVIYSDYNFMRAAIGSWSKKELPVWKHLKETTEYEYNPIWNKDGIVKETEVRDLTLKDTHAGKDSRIETTDQTRDAETNAKQYQDVAAYDTSDYTSRDYNHGNTTSNAGTIKATDDFTHGHTLTRTDGGSVTTTREEHGNIGVTTTQSMIKEEREIAQFNVIDEIVKSFKKRFCLMVY